MVELLKHQQEFVEATERDVMMLAPMATGKTFVQLYDAKEYALKYPGSVQVYMAQNPVVIQQAYNVIFQDCAVFNRIKGLYEFANGSRVHFIRIESWQNDMTNFEKLYGLKIDIFRMDTDIFWFGYEFYKKNVCQIMRPPSCQPKQIKITAKDTRHSIIKGGRFRIIDVEKTFK